MITLAVLLVAILIGVVAAIAPIGPVTVLFIRNAIAGDFAGALAIGMGRVPPEVVYCGAATYGMATVLREFPGAKFTIQVVGTMLIAALGIWFAFFQKRALDDELRSSRRGRWAGFLISAMNPALLLSWSAVTALAMSATGVEPTLLQKAAFAIGVGCGIALGYLALLWILKRYDGSIDTRVVRRIIRIVGLAFIAVGVSNAVRLFELL